MERILASGATPTIPSGPILSGPPSVPCPAIMEAIHVPCSPQLGLSGEVCTPV